MLYYNMIKYFYFKFIHEQLRGGINHWQIKMQSKAIYQLGEIAIQQNVLDSQQRDLLEQDWSNFKKYLDLEIDAYNLLFFR